MMLKDPGAVLLVSCYELGHEPHGVSVPAAFLERAGFRPARLDLSQCRLDEGAVRAARFVGLAVPMHTALRIGADTMRRVRAINPRAFVCGYGLYAWLNAEYLLDGLADAVIGGEYEDALARLVRDLDAGGDGAVPGVWRRGRPAAPVLERLDFPVPSRAPAPAPYARLVRDGRELAAGYTETTRGCLHHCLHCPIPAVYGGRFFAVPRDVVLEDVRRQVAAGARHITFGDPDFLNGPAHGLRVARALHAEFRDVTFDVTAKVEHLLRHRDLLPELAELGCLFVVSAVESLSDRVLAALDKGHSRRDALDVAGVVRRAGITLRPSLLPFTPWATLADYRELLDWVAAEDLIDCVDPVQWSIRLLAPPGSLLLSRAAMTPYLAGLDAESLTYRWIHPDPRMDRLHEVVSAVVADGAAAGEGVETTFGRVRNAALQCGMRNVECGMEERATIPHSAFDIPHLTARPPSPRLTEPWFC